MANKASPSPSLAGAQVRLLSSAIDETPNGEIIFRGVLDPPSIQYIRVDDYQREVLPLSMVESLVSGFKNHDKIPDVVIGMRGSHYKEHKDGATILSDEVYIIDGLQRISVAMELMKEVDKNGHPTINPHVGAMVYFNTTKEIEKALFTILNTRQQKLSSNILIRNLMPTNAAVRELYNLSLEKDFALHDMICWDQKLKRGQRMSCLGLIKIAAQLHGMWGPGLSTRWEQAASGLNKTMASIGRKVMRDNVRLFFDVINRVWKLNEVGANENAPYLKSTFLVALCRVFADHKNFWTDNRNFVVDNTTLHKLSTFRMSRMIQSLAGAGSNAGQVIYVALLDHLQKGRRTSLLIPFRETTDATTPKRRNDFERRKLLEEMRAKTMAVGETEED